MCLYAAKNVSTVCLSSRSRMNCVLVAGNGNGRSKQAMLGKTSSVGVDGASWEQTRRPLTAWTVVLFVAALSMPC